MDAAFLDRLPPHSREIERALIGGILRDPECLDDVQRIVAADDFYFDAHQKVFAVIVALMRERRPIDLVAICEELTKAKDLENVGGAVYLAELWDSAATGANAIHNAKGVREYSVLRLLIHAATEVIRNAFDRVSSADDLLSSAERTLREIADGSTQAQDPPCLPELVQKAFTEIDARQAGAMAGGFSSGFSDLDVNLGGFRPGTLVVIGPRPSTGKTALALALLVNACRSGVPALFSSLEMPTPEIVHRLLAMGCSVNLSRVSRAKLSEVELDAISQASEIYKSTRLYIDDSPHTNTLRLHAQTRRLIRRHGVGLLAVDYLQLLQPSDPRENRVAQVGRQSREMKLIARDCNIPVILLSQLNRESDSRGDGRPKLSDLRESGAIEQDADVVILLHVPAGQNESEECLKVTAIVAKNRNGPIGDVQLIFRRPYVRFESMAIGDQQR